MQQSDLSLTISCWLMPTRSFQPNCSRHLLTSSWSGSVSHLISNLFWFIKPLRPLPYLIPNRAANSYSKCSTMFALSRKTSALSFSPAMQNIVPWTSSCANDNVGTERKAGDRFRGQDGDESGGTLHLTTDQIQVLRWMAAVLEPGQGSPGTPQRHAC